MRQLFAITPSLAVGSRRTIAVSEYCDITCGQNTIRIAIAANTKRKTKVTASETPTNRDSIVCFVFKK